MEPAVRLAASLLALGLLLGPRTTPAAAQDAPPGDGTQVQKRRALAARVARLRGAARVQPPGGEWRPLSERDLLESGDRVQADGALELVLPQGEDALRDLSVDSGDRVILAPDAEVTVDPLDSSARLRLDQGGCFAFSMGTLVLEAAGGLFALGVGDVELEVSRRGEAELTVHQGSVTARRPDGDRRIAASERLTLDARGEKVRVRKAKPRRPDYVEQLERPAPAALLFAETFRDVAGRRYTEWVGAVTADGVVAERPPPEEGEGEGDPILSVHLGYTPNEGALFRHQAGVVVRIRYRVDRSVPIAVQVTYEGANYKSKLAGARPGVWTETEFHPSHFPPNGDPGSTARVDAGATAQYLDVYTDDLGAKLEVSRILVYRTR